MKKILWILGLGILLTILLLSPVVIASPPAQQPTRFRSILVNHDADIDGDLDVDGTANLDAVDIDGAVDFATTLNVDGATTLNSTLDVDGNVTSGTGSFTVADSINVTGAADFDSTLNVDGNVSSATGAFTVTDIVLIDGQADAIQLTVQGWTTQTTNLTVFEQSDGTDVLTITNAGAIDAASTIQFGTDDNFALGYASSAQEIACVSATITGTAAVAVTGITTPTWGMATLVTDPGAGAGDPFLVTFDAPTTTSLIVNVWQDDATAGASGAVVHVCAIGNE